MLCTSKYEEAVRLHFQNTLPNELHNLLLLFFVVQSGSTLMYLHQICTQQQCQCCLSTVHTYSSIRYQDQSQYQVLSVQKTQTKSTEKPDCNSAIMELARSHSCCSTLWRSSIRSTYTSISTGSSDATTTPAPATASRATSTATDAGSERCSESAVYGDIGEPLSTFVISQFSHCTMYEGKSYAPSSCLWGLLLKGTLNPGVSLVTGLVSSLSL